MFVLFLMISFRFLFEYLQAPTKSEQEALATRFELKVAASKRAHW